MATVFPATARVLTSPAPRVPPCYVFFPGNPKGLCPARSAAPVAPIPTAARRGCQILQVRAWALPVSSPRSVPGCPHACTDTRSAQHAHLHTLGDASPPAARGAPAPPRRPSSGTWLAEAPAPLPRGEHAARRGAALTVRRNWISSSPSPPSAMALRSEPCGARRPPRAPSAPAPARAAARSRGPQGPALQVPSAPRSPPAEQKRQRGGGRSAGPPCAALCGRRAAGPPGAQGRGPAAQPAARSPGSSERVRGARGARGAG